MIANKGFIIEEDRGVPDGEERPKSFDPRYVDEYFARDLTLDSDDEDDDGNEGNADLSFDLRAQKMVDLLPDGGVKKKVLLYLDYRHFLFYPIRVEILLIQLFSDSFCLHSEM